MTILILTSTSKACAVTFINSYGAIGCEESEPRKLLTTFGLPLGNDKRASDTRIRKKTVLEWYVLGDHVYA
jgi:hypothetical protein